MRSTINFWAVLMFFSIAILCRYLTNVADIFSFVENPYLKILLTGVGPAIGAFVVFWLFKIKPVMSLKGNYKNLTIPFLIYWILPIILISLAVYFVNGTLPRISVLVILLYGLLEEIGWRGFLHEHLKPLPLFANIMIVATLWFIWHLNFEISLSNLLFYAILIFGSWGIGKVADLTQSLFAVSAFHSLNNFFPEMDSIKIIILVSLLLIWISTIVIRKQWRENLA